MLSENSWDRTGRLELTRTRPMSLRAGFIAIGLVAAVVYIYGIHTHNLQLRQWSKPWPVAFMILEAARVNTSYGRWVTGALVFCVGGDILLEYKEETFVHGLVSFLIGHLAYIVAFRKIAAKVNLFALVVYGALTALVFFLSKDGAGDLTIPVAFYSCVITAMVTYAASSVSVLKKTGASSKVAYAAAVGATMFLLSDGLIALSKFKYQILAFRYAIIILYWLGQWLITWSALHINVAQTAVLKKMK